MRVSKALKRRREERALAERQAEIQLPDDRPRLLLWGLDDKPYYIAVCRHGFGVDKIPAMAIRLAQTEVPAHARESQLLIYESIGFIEPTGFKDGAPVWPDESTRPKLVGLTTTHRAFRQSPR